MIVSQMLGAFCVGIRRRTNIRTVVSFLLLLSLCHQGQSIWCVQCEGGIASGEECMTRPPEPQPCRQEMSVCMTVRTYSPSQPDDDDDDDDDRRLVSLVRTCGPADMGRDCERGQTEEKGSSVEVCYDTCSSDGCNPSRSLSPSAPLLFLSLLGAAPALTPLLGAAPA